jgi:hypothetical protein
VTPAAAVVGPSNEYSRPTSASVPAAPVLADGLSLADALSLAGALTLTDGLAALADGEVAALGLELAPAWLHAATRATLPAMASRRSGDRRRLMDDSSRETMTRESSGARRPEAPIGR